MNIYILTYSLMLHMCVFTPHLKATLQPAAVVLRTIPALGGCLQAVGFWELQILQCGIPSLLSVGHFSSGKAIIF